MTSSTRAVVLLSGGLDSATTLAIALERGRTAYALSFRYGQRHAIELQAAKAVAASMRVTRHIFVDIDLRALGGSALTADIPVPKDRSRDELSQGIPVTYVPARNTIFLSWALAWAEVLNAPEIFIGVNALDYSGYPDCRPEFLEAFERVANLGTKSGIEGGQFRIRAPLMQLTKAEIIRRGAALGVDYALSVSCYDPRNDGAACGRCDSCQLRLNGFREAGMVDPAGYV